MRRSGVQWLEEQCAGLLARYASRPRAPRVLKTASVVYEPTGPTSPDAESEKQAIVDRLMALCESIPDVSTNERVAEVFVKHGAVASESSSDGEFEV